MKRAAEWIYIIMVPADQISAAQRLYLSYIFFLWGLIRKINYSVYKLLNFWRQYEFDRHDQLWQRAETNA